MDFINANSELEIVFAWFVPKTLRFDNSIAIHKYASFGDRFFVHISHFVQFLATNHKANLYGGSICERAADD